MSETKTEALTALNDIGVSSFAVETLGNEVWSKLAQFAQDEMDKGTVIEDLRKMFKEAEKKLKDDFEVTAMPSSWRSAKADVLGAVVLGIPLMDDNGKPVGKSAIEQAIKMAKMAKASGVVGKEDDKHKAASHVNWLFRYIVDRKNPIPAALRDKLITIVENLDDE